MLESTVAWKHYDLSRGWSRVLPTSGGVRREKARSAGRNVVDNRSGKPCSQSGSLACAWMHWLAVSDQYRQAESDSESKGARTYQ